MYQNILIIISLLSLAGTVYFTFFAKGNEPISTTKNQNTLFTDDNFGPEYSITFHRGGSRGFISHWSSDPLVLLYYHLKGHPLAINRLRQFICSIIFGLSLMELLNRYFGKHENVFFMSLFLWGMFLFFIFLIIRSYFKAKRHIKKGTTPEMGEIDRASYTSTNQS